MGAATEAFTTKPPEGGYGVITTAHPLVTILLTELTV